MQDHYVIEVTLSAEQARGVLEMARKRPHLALPDEDNSVGAVASFVRAVMDQTS